MLLNSERVADAIHIICWASSLGLFSSWICNIPLKGICCKLHAGVRFTSSSTVSWHIYQSISVKSHMNYTKLCQTFRSFSGASLLGLSLSNCNEKLGSGALEWRLRKMHPPVARTKIISIFCWRISPQALSSPSQDLEFQECVFISKLEAVTFIWEKNGSGCFCHHLGFLHHS